MPTRHHALEQIYVDATAMGVDLTEFSDAQIRPAYYKAQCIHGIDRDLPYAALLSSIKTYAGDC